MLVLKNILIIKFLLWLSLNMVIHIQTIILVIVFGVTVRVENVLRPASYLNYTAHAEDDVVNNAVLLRSALRRSRSNNSKVITMALDGREV